MKKYYCLFILLFLFSNGCKKKADDLNVPATSHARLVLLKGGSQTGYYGADLHDTIDLKIIPKTGEYVTSYFLTWSPAIGNGQARFFGTLYDIGYAHADSTSWLIWSLGCNRPDQVLVIFLFPGNVPSFDHSNAIDSLFIPASGLKPAGWARACGLPPDGNWGVDLKNSGYRVFCLSSTKIFYSDDGGINWQEATGFPGVSLISDYQVNSQGVVYAVRDQEGLFSSSDLHTWNRISDGISNPHYPTTMLIEDSVIWVSYNFCGLHRSRDNGHTWQQLLINGGYGEGYKHLKRAPNGTLYLFDKWNVLWKSADNGNSWSNILLEYQYFHPPASDLAFDGSGNLLLGSNDAMISILSPSTFTGPVHLYYEWNSNVQFINQITLLDSSVYFMVRYTPKPGLYSSVNGWNKVNTGFPKEETDYLRLSDGSYLFGTREGLFYYGKK